MSLLKEIVELNEETIDALPVIEKLDEAVRELGLRHAGGLIKPKHRQGVKGNAIKAFFNANPGLVTKAATLAINGLNDYNKYLRKTIKLHAKTDYEKRMMTSIVKSLKNSGNFKLWRVKYEGGGKTWEMKFKK